MLASLSILCCPQNNIVGCKAFISTPLEIAGAALANVFHEVKVNLVSGEAERICIDRMVKGQEDAFTTPEGLAEVDSRMASLVSLLARVAVQTPLSCILTCPPQACRVEVSTCWL